MKVLFTKKHYLKFLFFSIITFSYLVINATPTITIIGKDSIKHQVNTTYTDMGATAVDDNSNNITLFIIVTGTVNVNAFGTYKITYTVTDNYGKTSSKTRTVIVADCIPPVLLTDSASDSISVCVNDLQFTEPRVTATDNYFTTVNITRNGNYDITKIGSYTITYTAKDGAGNSSTYTRVIRVKVCQKPTIITTGIQQVYFVNDPIDLLKGISVWDGYYPPSDFINGTNGCSIQIISSNVDNSKVGNYEVAYQATNGGGLKSDTTKVMIWIRQLMSLEENQQKTHIKIYPNPTTDILSIEQITDKAFTAALSTIEGKTLFTKDLTPANNTISVGHLAKGIYYLTVKGLNTLYTQKVIITK